MARLDKQATFDKVVTHLLVQNAQAMHGAQCRYRTEDGLSCAIGCLIPDKLYTKEMEGLGVDEVYADPELEHVLLEALGVEDLTMDDLTFLSDLQYLHDNREADRWRTVLENFATSNSLDFNPPCPTI